MLRTVTLVALLTLAAAVPAQARVDGISDNNLPLLTREGARIASAIPVSDGRVVIPYGTDQKSTDVRLWMRINRGLGWTTTVAVSRNSGSPAPTPTGYSAWLRRLLRLYPQISAVEATNEPDITRISTERAVALYRAARRACPSAVRVLAGGFSDRAGSLKYIRQYARRLGYRSDRLWAFHFYRSVVDNDLRHVHGTLAAARAQRAWVTETASFAALGEREFTAAQRRAQTRRVLRISDMRGISRTYWQGLEECDGCQPAVTHFAAIANGVFPPAPALPYALAYSPIVWDSYLISSTSSVTTIRPPASVFEGGS